MLWVFQGLQTVEGPLPYEFLAVPLHPGLLSNQLDSSFPPGLVMLVSGFVFVSLQEAKVNFK